MKLTEQEVTKITREIFEMAPGADLFDNVPSDMTWGELVRAIADLLPVRGEGDPT